MCYHHCNVYDVTNNFHWTNGEYHNMIAGQDVSFNLTNTSDVSAILIKSAHTSKISKNLINKMNPHKEQIINICSFFFPKSNIILI